MDDQAIRYDHPQVDELHVWTIEFDCSVDVSRITAILSPPEQARAKRLRVPDRREAFIFYRAQVRTILAGYLGCAAREVPIVTAAQGKPMLAPPCPLTFNLSHRAEIALLVVGSGVSVGIDVECLDPQSNYDALAQQALSDRERSLYEGLPSHERPAAMLRAWTRKEAFLKATGEALTRPLCSIEVTFLAGEPPKLLATGAAAEPPDEWSLQAWSPRPEWFAAVALPSKSARLNSRQFVAAPLSELEAPADRSVLSLSFT